MMGRKSALRAVLPADTADKLRKMADLDRRAIPLLSLLNLCAYILWVTVSGLVDVPMPETTEDLAAFEVLTLAPVLVEIGETLAESFPRDPLGGFLLYLEDNTAPLFHADYAERLTRIQAAGKEALLLRLAAKKLA